MIWHWLAAGTMAAVAVVHAVLGERRLIGPQIAARQGVMQHALARQVTRFAWHLTSVLMLLCALVVVWPGTPSALVAIVGAAWLASGLIDAAMTRGRHIGWPFLSAAGLLALAAGLFG